MSDHLDTATVRFRTVRSDADTCAHPSVPRRGPRILAVASATLLLLSSAASSWVAAADAVDVVSQVAVAVNGTSTLIGESDPGTVSLEGDVVRVRGNVLQTVEEANDTRASGRATITVNVDAYPDAGGATGTTQVRFGNMRLVNADGAWSGHFLGSLANGGFVQTYWLKGEGAFEGLSYLVIAGGNGPVWRSQGLIVPGRLPIGAGLDLPIDSLDRDIPAVSSVQLGGSADGQ